MGNFAPVARHTAESKNILENETAVAVTRPGKFDSIRWWGAAIPDGLGETVMNEYLGTK